MLIKRGRGEKGRLEMGRSSISCLFAMALLAALLLPVSGASAADVSGDRWVFNLESCGPVTGIATAEYTIGPGIPPRGSGSFEMSVPANGLGYPQLQTADFDGTYLSDLSALSYSTFVDAFGPQPVAAFMLLEVDQNLDGTVDDELVYQPAAQDTVEGKYWQTWNALSGNWWSVHGLAGIALGTAGGSLDDYVAAYPDARIVNAGSGGLRLAAGCIGTGWSTFTGSVDAVVVGVNGVTTTYDFESDGVHVTSPVTGEDHPGLPTFTNLSPAPFSTVAPGGVVISADVTSDSPIETVTMTVGDQQVIPSVLNTLTTGVMVSTTRPLAAGTYTVTMTATDSDADTFTSQWDIVVSNNAGDDEWFNANGTPKAAQINATMTSLVQAFRWHLFGQTWDGQPHPEMPTHADTVTNGAALSDWVNGTTFDEAATNATLRSLVEAFRWHFWGISWDGKAHAEMPTHATVVQPPQGIDPWFTASGDPIPENISATLKSLVQAFRWHFWGYSWDGQHHFTDMPTHAY